MLQFERGIGSEKRQTVHSSIENKTLDTLSMHATLSKVNKTYSGRKTSKLKVGTTSQWSKQPISPINCQYNVALFVLT